MIGERTKRTNNTSIRRRSGGMGEMGEVEAHQENKVEEKEWDDAPKETRKKSMGTSKPNENIEEGNDGIEWSSYYNYSGIGGGSRIEFSDFYGARSLNSMKDVDGRCSKKEDW